MAELLPLDALKRRLPESSVAPSEAPPTEEQPIEEPTLPPITEPITEPPSALLPLGKLKDRLPERTVPEKIETEIEEVTGTVLQGVGDVAEELVQTSYERLLGIDVSDPQELERLVFNVTGAYAGGQAGAKVPGPPWLKAITTLGGGIAGVAAGSGVPEVYWNTLEALGIIPPGAAKEKALSADELKQLIKGEVLLEIVTLGGVSALRLGGRLTGQLFTGMTKEGRRIAEESAALGINLMPVQIGDRIFGKAYVSVAGRFPLIGPPFVRRGIAAEKAFARQVEEMPERIAPLFSQTKLGIKIYNEGRELLKVMNDGFDKKYKDLFTRAEAADVGVRPEHTLAEAHKIKEQMLKRSPTGVDEALGLTNKEMDELYQGYSDFLDKHIFKMEKFPPTGDITYVRREQTFREMDGVASLLDRYALTLEGGKKRAIQNFNAKLKQAVLLDMKTNAFGANANDFQLEMRALDENFSHVMGQYFETATAKRWAKVRRRGIRAIEFDEWTMQNVDQLAKFVIDTKSPELLKDLRKLVTPSTWRSIKASILYDALQKPITPLAEQHYAFDANAFRKAIGFDSKTNPVRETFEELFKRGNVTTDDIEKFLKIGLKISGLEIPNVSAFVARRAILAGRGGIWGAFAVGAAGSAGAGYEQGGFLGLAINTALFVGGARLLSAILANPLTARPLMKVLDSEASTVQKRAVLLRILRTGLEGVGYGVEGLQEKGQELYEGAYPNELGEGNISEPVKKYYRRLLPTPGLTEEQLQKGSERQQKKEIDLVMAYANGYIDLGLGKEPEEPSIVSEYSPYVPNPVYHTGGQVRDFNALSANLDKMPNLQREKHLRNMFQKDRKTFDRLLEHLENR